MPILIVERGGPPQTLIGKVLVPLDGTAAGDPILPAVTNLAPHGACALLTGEGQCPASTACVAELRQDGCLPSSMVIESTDAGNVIISQLSEDISAEIIAMLSHSREHLSGVTLGH